MTGVQKINIQNPDAKPFLTPKNTGYAAAAVMLLTGMRTFTSCKPLRKSHKILGCITAGLTLLHIGLIEYYHHKYKNL